MDIACSTDTRYIMPLGVMLTSLVINNPTEELHIHIIIDDSVTEEDKAMLRRTVEDEDGQRNATFYRFDHSLMNTFPQIGKMNKWISEVAYYRLLLAEILPPTVDRVLYLDGDTLVRHSLRDLEDFDISDVAVAAVIDQSDGWIEIFNRLRYPFDLGYFNSGVMLINLKRWREQHLQKVFLDYIRNHQERISLHDQDVLNATLCRDKIALPIKYNVQLTFYDEMPYLKFDYWKYEKELEAALRDPAIFHFVEMEKPWKEGCSFPLRYEWLKYKQQSLWKDAPLWPELIPKKSLRTRVGDLLRALHLKAPLPAPHSVYRTDIQLLD